MGNEETISFLKNEGDKAKELVEKTRHFEEKINNFIPILYQFIQKKEREEEKHQNQKFRSKCIISSYLF